jgi:hypothetical protein
LHQFGFRGITGYSGYVQGARLIHVLLCSAFVMEAGGRILSSHKQSHTWFLLSSRALSLQLERVCRDHPLLLVGPICRNRLP